MHTFKIMNVGLVALQVIVQLMSSGIAQAQQGSNQCGNYPKVYDLTGVCGNRPLPSDKVRNLRGLHLECGSGVDHYVRTFIPFNAKKWKRFENQGKSQLENRKDMQNYRLEEPVIAWSGTIPYETTEIWRWTDCVYGADPVCGYHEECHDEQVCTTDSEGKQKCHTERVCVQVMNSCYHDEDQSESRYCSTEQVNFSASFAKPKERDTSWGPNAQGYYDVIPNKYDLLPGEVEDVQMFANSGRGTSVTPKLEVGDAWNNYSPRIVLAETGSGSAACRQGQTLNATVKIYTDSRIYGKTTPNAFRIPVNEKGKEQNPLEWTEVTNSTKSKDTKAALRYKPYQIKLMDVSHTMISAMARQSRKFEIDREEAKAANGQGGTQTPKEYTKNKTAAEKDESGFWKATNVRVRLKEITGRFARNIRPTHNIFTTGEESTIDGMYDLMLAGQSKDKDLYRASGPIKDSWWDGYSVELKKKQKYKLLVSMYQDGVPFYKQSKDKKSSSAYSKELEINFVTDDLDKRGLMQKFLNWQGRW